MKFCSLSVLGEQQQQQWQKHFIKSVFKLFQNSSLLFQVIIVKLLMLMSFPGVELSRTVLYLTLKREY